MVRRLNAGDDDFQGSFQELLSAKRETSEEVSQVVLDIIDQVRTAGDEAVLALTSKFDLVELTPETLRFSEQEIDAAVKACKPDALAALDLAAQRIRAFHERQKPTDDRFTDSAGVELGQKWTAVAAAGIYVPGGTAAYPSSVLMNAIPAMVAGAPRVAMVVPTPGGEINPLVLAAARKSGISEIYKLGGAQAIAALAYGTNSVPRVDKIVGPGNAYVAAAKRHVFGVVGIDMIAGPSEILVLADNQNDPAWLAADLLSQAEHDPSSQSILITHDPVFADSVAEAVESQLGSLSRQEIARASWNDFGAIIVVASLDDAIPLVNAIAPEHLELAVPDERAQQLAEVVAHAGAIFLGRHTPEAIGDYVAGTNHVLPTARSARFASGLSVYDFMKRTSLVKCSPDSLAHIGRAAITLAETEGLDAHARSVSIRLNR
jgi:histidinol dehydrogenase